VLFFKNTKSKRSVCYNIEMIGSLIRDIGLGLFVNGLFTITQNGFSFNALITTFIAIKILAFGILIQKKQRELEE